MRFKPKKPFGTLDSDLIIDFKKRKVIFTNHITIFDSKYIMSALILSLFLDLFFFTCFFITPFKISLHAENGIREILAIQINLETLILLFFLDIPISYGIVLLYLLPQHPTIQRFLEKLHKKRKPYRTIEVNKPSSINMTVYGAVRVRYIGNCGKYRDKLVLVTRRNLLKLSFTKRVSGKVIIEEF